MIQSRSLSANLYFEEIWGGAALTDYGQFCPVAKATELLGEKWTILILRELFLGTHRYN
jgi:DNA-binding HxlR family transcriptional regulator